MGNQVMTVLERIPIGTDNCRTSGGAFHSFGKRGIIKTRRQSSGCSSSSPAPDMDVDFLAYVGHMNNLIAMAEEAMLHGIIYT